jgi:glucose/galactose transporter
MYFTVGFTMGINSYLLPLLQSTLEVSAGESYLVLAATFSAFLLFGYPSSFLIKKIGYKRTMALAFAIYAIGFTMFISSAHRCSLSLFLLASFLCGTGNAVLQAAINPYVTILGPIESAAKRMSIMGICNAFAWPTAPIILSLIIGKNIEEVALIDITKPFLIISVISLILSVVMLFAPLKEIKAKGEDEAHWDDCPYAAHKKSILQFPHLLIGCITLFFYVGVETIASATTVDYAADLGLSNPDRYAVYPSIGMVTGYICGILFIPKLVSQKMALTVCTYIAVTGTLLVVFSPPEISIVCITVISLGCSLMYPSLWPLAIVDLGRFTKTGSSLLVTSIVGGAVIPTCFGFLKDKVGSQDAYWLCLPCFLFILFYARHGCKIRTDSK